jgi:nicotinamidase/pyrazinamidase
MEIPIENVEIGDAVLAIDVQKDFCAGGTLGVNGSDAVVPVLNQWIETAFLKEAPVYLSRDWHPIKHPSFKENGGPWPPHCIQDTDGARFHPDLKRPENADVVTKGTRFDINQYSAFDRTGLRDRLVRDGIRRVWIGGIALDVCVFHTVMDAIKNGFDVHVISAGTRPVDPEEGRKAIKEMKNAGATIV